jgi:hypothetical protein
MVRQRHSRRLDQLGTKVLVPAKRRILGAVVPDIQFRSSPASTQSQAALLLLTPPWAGEETVPLALDVFGTEDTSLGSSSSSSSIILPRWRQTPKYQHAKHKRGRIQIQEEVHVRTFIASPSFE